MTSWPPVSNSCTNTPSASSTTEVTLAHSKPSIVSNPFRVCTNSRCIAGALLAFTLSVDEFIIAFFTAGAGRHLVTLPMQIFAMIRFGVTPEINALSTIVMCVSVVPSEADTPL